MDDFICLASAIAEPTFHSGNWNVKRERFDEMDQTVEVSHMKLKEHRIEKKMSKQQFNFCTTLIKVLIAAENRGDGIEFRSIVKENFSPKCAGRFIKLFEIWRCLQSDVVRTYDAVEILGNDVRFETHNSGTCMGDAMGAASSIFNSYHSSNPTKTMLQHSELTSGDIERISFIISSKSLFHWRLNMSTNKIDTWDVQNHIEDVQKAFNIVTTPMNPSAISIDSFPLMFCNSCNSGDIVFLRQMFSKFVHHDALIFHFTSQGISAGSYRSLLEGEILNPTVPDQVRRMVAQTNDSNFIRYRSVLEGTVIFEDEVTADAGGAWTARKPLRNTKRVAKVVEVMFQVDRSSNMIVRAAAKVLHSRQTSTTS